LRNKGQLDEAIAKLRRAIELKPDLAEVHRNLSNALCDKGRFDEAIAGFRRAIALKPDFAEAYNDLAWLLATSPDPEFVDPTAAIELAKNAVKLSPGAGAYWNTLGTAQYRTGLWDEAIAALQKSMDLTAGGIGFDWFFLAMAHWQLGDKEAARTWHDKAVEWMDKNQPQNEELRRFREEAAVLLGVTDVAPAAEALNAVEKQKDLQTEK
jgi:tetratricopeptide (TPR) repeat protein